MVPRGSWSKALGKTLSGINAFGGMIVLPSETEPRQGIQVRLYIGPTTSESCFTTTQASSEYQRWIAPRTESAMLAPSSTINCAQRPALLPSKTIEIHANQSGPKKQTRREGQPSDRAGIDRYIYIYHSPRNFYKLIPLPYFFVIFFVIFTGIRCGHRFFL